MAIRRYIWKVKDSAADPSARPPCYWVIDAESELPTIAHEGCLAYAKDTDSLYRCVSLGTWEVVGDGGGGPATWGSITGTLSNQTDLQGALDGKAASGHTHSIANVTGLQSALDGKAASPILDGDLPASIARDSEVTSAIANHESAGDPHPLYELEAQKNAANGYAGLSAGKLSGVQVPYGSSTSTACEGNDARLSDARTPLAHNIITAHNGFPGGTSTFLRGDGTFASPGGGAGADPPEGSYAPGSYTIATGKFRLAALRQQFTSAQQLAIQGSGRLSLRN